MVSKENWLIKQKPEY